MPAGLRRRIEGAARGWPLAPALSLLVLFFAAPLASFLVFSFWRKRALRMVPDLTGTNYLKAVADYADTFAITLLTSLAIASLTTLIAFGYAYALRFRLQRQAGILLLVPMITLFGGYLVKIYTWKSILGTEGILNSALLGLDLIETPIQALIYSQQGVIVTLTYFLLPFAILPIHASLRSVRDVTLEAARDLGAGPWRVLIDILLPQCRGGLSIAFALCFFAAAGDYVTPQYVGGGSAMIGVFIENRLTDGFHWPLASAMSFIMLGLSLISVLLVTVLLPRLIGWALSMREELLARRLHLQHARVDARQREEARI